jgi:hypothetical protein
MNDKDDEILKHLVTNSCDIYTFTYVIGEIKREVTIVFENKVFAHVKFTFNCVYSRREWNILEAINQKIVELEKNYAAQ